MCVCFVSVVMNTMSISVDQFQSTQVYTSHIHSTCTLTTSAMCGHIIIIMLLYILCAGCDPNAAVCLYTSKGEWQNLGMASTQEIVGTSKI